MTGGGAPGTRRSGTAVGAGPPVLVAEGITKRFAGRAVLSDVSIAVNRGEVHALVGPNGSGKSTLVKIVSGFHEASEFRELRIDGAPYPSHPDAAALARLGLRVVHQDLGLIPELSIVENVALAVGYARRGTIVNWRQTNARVGAALALVGLERSVNTTVDELAAWERAAVAFARALYNGLDSVRLLLLDEITAALSRDQVIEVLATVRRMRDLGAGILYVTHRFEEVFDIADRVTVLGDGSVIASGLVSEFSADDLVALVAGHSLRAHSQADGRVHGEVVLSARELRSPRLRDVSFEVRAGEVCGVIGRAGCGRSALGRAVFGLERLSGGEIRLGGRLVTRRSVPRMVAEGVAYVPQDRLREGIVPQASVRENLSLADLSSVSRWGLVNPRRERAIARALVDAYAVRPPEPELLIDQLSGGNQQKVVVARWMTRPRRLFVLDEPTEGVDAGARHIIYNLIAECCQAGAAVLLLSSSIEEIVQVCDRALFMSAGEIVAHLGAEELTVHNVEELLLVGGGAAHRRAPAPRAAGAGISNPGTPEA